MTQNEIVNKIKLTKENYMNNNISIDDMMDILDDYDRNTLTAYVNLLTSQKAESAKSILDERNQELDQIQSRVGAY